MCGVIRLHICCSHVYLSIFGLIFYVFVSKSHRRMFPIIFCCLYRVIKQSESSERPAPADIL